MRTQNIVAITGDQLAHNYFLNQLRSNFKLSAIFIEKNRYPEGAAQERHHRVATKRPACVTKKTG